MTTESAELDIEGGAPRLRLRLRRSRLKHLTDTIENLKRVLCVIQGRFAEYAYNSHLADHDLQQALIKKDKIEIERSYQRSNSTLNIQLEKDIGVFTKQIQQVFVHKGGQFPRVCFKRPYTFNGVEKVIVISRDRGASYTNEYELQKNTGFRNVKKTGSYYICNNIPKELAADIYQTGIYLTGGGALLRGLSPRIASKTKLTVHIADDPLRAVVRGTGLALKNSHRYSFLIDRRSI